ncbi:hypothetical protein [Burkholderia ubonensis]|uniref:hypothetical protein n=1 Tax=Burkholderia ubonensis TaxID=101571 RepID=UPI00076DA7C0|nr:hypothetical protein [Burkholderia ubonensis]KVP17060.1 hypothetical protein WJ84_01945 [Burkholderia ubonensis]
MTDALRTQAAVIAPEYTLFDPNRRQASVSRRTFDTDDTGSQFTRWRDVMDDLQVSRGDFFRPNAMDGVSV